MQVVTHCESEVCLRTIRVLKWFPALFAFSEVGYVEGVEKLIHVLHKLCRFISPTTVGQLESSTHRFTQNLYNSTLYNILAYFCL